MKLISQIEIAKLPSTSIEEIDKLIDRSRELRDEQKNNLKALHEIKKQKKLAKAMDNAQMGTVHENSVRIARVTFSENKKPYAFKTDIANLKKGDRVLVETIYGLQVATFCNYLPSRKFDEINPSKWILCRDGLLKEDIRNYGINVSLKVDTLTPSTPTFQRPFE